MGTRFMRLLSCLIALACVSSAQAELIGHWTLDETSGTTAADSSGRGHNGTYEGSPDLTVLGVFGTGLDSTGGYMEADLGADLPSGAAERTIALWVNFPQVQVDRKFFGYGTESAGLAFTFCMENVNGEDGVRMRHWGGNMMYPGTTTNEWNHITIRVPAGATIVNDTEVFINGENIPGYRSGGSDQTLNTSATPIHVGTSIGGQTGQVFEGAFDDVWFFDHALTDEEVLMVIAGTPKELASAPGPEDGMADVPRDASLSWAAGEYAVTHDIYLGAAFDDVNDASRADPRGVLVGEGQSAQTYDAGRLEFGQTYYWRVDEVNGAPDNTIFKGNVWSFTIEPFAYPIGSIIATASSADPGAGPENTVNGSGLDDRDQHSIEATDMWLAVPGVDPLSIQFEFDGVYKLHEMLVWNYNVAFELILGFGIKDVTVEYSADGTDWTALGDVVFTQGTATADYAANTTVDFGGVAAKYVKLTALSGHGMMGQFGLSEVRFLHIAVQASEPQPADGEAGVAPDTALSWRAGREAAVHEIYLGTDPETLTLLDTSAEPTATPDTLEFGTTYAWRIDEVNEAETPSTWEGDLWTFSTVEYAVIDDMEGYDDDENRIYDAWLDGFVNDTGSTVGYFEAPFAEQTIVNSGGQSMPMEYANDTAPFYSEIEYDLGSLNLDTNGADSLRLFVSGQTPAFLETADGSILMNAIGTDIWGTADEGRYAYKELSGNGSIVARVDARDASPNGWMKVGVMIRQSTAPGSQHAFMCITGGSGNGYSYQRRIDTDGTSTSDNGVAPAIGPPYWVKIDRAGDVFAASVSPDGADWTEVGTAQTIAMADPVLIGLAVTSHNANQATGVALSNVSTTGNVIGNWEVAEIGVPQPIGNDIAPLYVAVEDTSGNVAVVTHPDEGIVGRSGWNEWVIPYSDLAGVNLNRVAIMYIGVGDRDNPTVGGTGMIFIDDIGYGKPAAIE